MLTARCHAKRHFFWFIELACTILCLCCAGSASAARLHFGQQGSPQASQTRGGTIRGVVSLQAAPLEGIHVELAGPAPDSQPTTAVTDATGQYEFTKLAP